MTEKIKPLCGLNKKPCPNPDCRYVGTGFGCLYLESQKPVKAQSAKKPINRN